MIHMLHKFYYVCNFMLFKAIEFFLVSHNDM